MQLHARQMRDSIHDLLGFNDRIFIARKDRLDLYQRILAFRKTPQELPVNFVLPAIKHFHEIVDDRRFVQHAETNALRQHCRNYWQRRQAVVYYMKKISLHIYTVDLFDQVLDIFFHEHLREIRPPQIDLLATGMCQKELYLQKKIFKFYRIGRTKDRSYISRGGKRHTIPRHFWLVERDRHCAVRRYLHYLFGIIDAP